MSQERIKAAEIGGFGRRGAIENPQNRFEKLAITPEMTDDLIDEEQRRPLQTEFLRDTSRSLLVRNNSPDVGFEVGINVYRGCEHGCAYCYARPYHEYIGFSAGLDFETKILVKEDASELLRKELMSHKWRPQTIGMSGVTDCYQPIERKLKLTRRVLQVLAEFRNPTAIITKNQLVARDADILADLAADKCVAVNISVTSLDPELSRAMEPRTSTPAGRLAAIRTLAEAGVPVGVMVAPVVPGLTDSEVPAIVQAAADAGAKWAGMTVVRLPGAVGGIFDLWLERHFPDRRKKVMGRIADVHGGKVSDSRFGTRMHGEGKHAEQITQLFDIACRKTGIADGRPELSTEAFRRAQEGQLSLFD